MLRQLASAADRKKENAKGSQALWESESMAQVEVVEDLPQAPEIYVDEELVRCLVIAL